MGFTSHGNLLSFQIFTSGTAQTYTRPAGITSILVECLGGGGGGGGAGGALTFQNAAGGGASGAYCRKWIASAAATYTYTVGAAGAAGAAANGVGGNGGDTTFSTLTAPGGDGGNAGFAAQAISTGVLVISGPGTPHAASGGDINITGSYGGYGMGFGANNTLSGFGAAAPLYGSSILGADVPNATAAAGNNGLGYGSGGSGGATLNVATNAAGGTGSAGLIIVWEFA